METLLNEFLDAGVLFFIVSAVLLVLRKVALGAVQRWAEKTDTEVDDIIIQAVRYPSLFLSFALGLYVALGTSSFPAAYVGYGLKALKVIIIISVTLATASLATKFIQFSLQKSALSVQTTGISRTNISGVVLTIGLLVILNSLGISITPLLTALGVGGLAVALALQDTMANLLAGPHLLFNRGMSQHILPRYGLS